MTTYRQRPNENLTTYVSRILQKDVQFAGDRLLPELALTRRQTQVFRTMLMKGEGLLNGVYGITPHSLRALQREGNCVRGIVETQVDRFSALERFYGLAEHVLGERNPALDIIEDWNIKYQVLLCNEASFEQPLYDSEFREGAALVIVDRDHNRSVKISEMNIDPETGKPLIPSAGFTNLQKEPHESRKSDEQTINQLFSDEEFYNDAEEGKVAVYFADGLSERVESGVLALYVMENLILDIRARDS